MISYIIPKKKDYYAFFPTVYTKGEFYGNVKALMSYIAQNHSEIETVLLSLDKGVIQKAQSNDFATKRTILGITWASLRAEHILINTATAGDFRIGRFSIIQLWHGSGFKEVGLLRPDYKYQVDRLKLNFKKFKLIISTSKSDAKKQNTSFNSTAAVVTGYPRNDLFFQDKSHFNDLKIKYGLKKYNRIISYTPTFRDYKSPTPFSEVFYQNLQSFLEKSNTVFIIKKHPADKFFKFPETFKNIQDLSHKFSNTQELLLITDLLISDYSSIITDFALTKKPILIYPYDLKQYKEKSRPMYYDIEKILPQPFIKDENDLLEKLKDESWMKTPLAINSYENFVQTFHQYLDGNSSKRVMEALQGLSNGSKTETSNRSAQEKK